MMVDVRLPDGRIIKNVPDGITQEDLLEMVGGAQPSAPQTVPLERAPRTMGQEIGRQLGLTARAPAGGLLSMASILADPVAEGLNAMLPGRPIARLSEAKDTILNQFFPTPENETERIVQGAAEIGSGAGLAGGLSKVANLSGKAPALAQELAQAPRIQAMVDKLPGGVRDYAQKALNMGLDVRNTRMADVFEELSKAPLIQAAAGGGAVAAPTIAERFTDNPAALTGAAVIGSIGAGAGVAGAGRLAAGAGQLAKTFAPSGQELAVGQFLNRTATNPSMAMREMLSAEEYVPGSLPTATQASRDPGLLRAEGAIRAVADDTGAYSARLADQNAARQDYLDKLGTEAKLAAAEAKRERTAQQKYNLAFRNAQPVQIGQEWINNPVLREVRSIMESPRGVNNAVRDAMAEVQDQFANAAADITDPRVLYEIRKNIAGYRDGTLSNPNRPNVSKAKVELKQVLDTLDNVIETGAPGYKDAVSIYAKQSIPIDQMKDALKLRQQASDAIRDPASAMPNLTPGAFIKGVDKIKTVQRELGTKNPNSYSFTKEQFRIMDDVVRDLERAYGSTSRNVRSPGSDTAKNLSVASILGEIIGTEGAKAATQSGLGQPIMKAFGFLMHIPEQQIRQILMEAILDPKLAAKLMQKATDANVEAIGQELKRRAALSAAAGQIYGSSP